MKKISLIFIVAICLALGVGRYLDLTYLTDLNGFVTTMNATIRYFAITVPILLVVLYAVVFLKKTPAQFSNKGFYIILIIVGFIHVFSSAIILINGIRSELSTITIVLSSSMFLTGIWFSFCGYASIALKKISPGNMAFPLLASAYYYILMLYQFVTTISSIERISSVVVVLIPMSVVLFLTNLIKQIYLLSYSTRGLTVSGVLCFLFACCISSAEIIHGIVNGTMLPVPLVQAISSFSIGILALYSVIVFNKEKQMDRTVLY